MEPSRKHLTDRFIHLVEQMYGQMHPGPFEEWSELELTMPQVRTLALLRQGPQRMSDIATYLGSGLSSATSMIDRLVNKGVVQRLHDPADRRVVTCYLTPLGEEEVKRFWRIGRLGAETVASLLTLQELEVVVHAIEILSIAVARQAEAAPSGPCATSTGTP